MDALKISLVAGAVGALAGVMAGALAMLGTDLSGAPAQEAQPPAPLDRRLGVGAFLLSSHAIAAAALWQLPTVGSCIAAGLGAGWMGAAAAGLIGMLSQPGGGLGMRAAQVLFRAAIGVALLAPLWAYMKILQLQALGTTQA